MHSIYDYIDAAKANSGISTDAELSRALGLTTPQVGFWKKKKSMPSCESMIKLAEMGNMDPDQALIEQAVAEKRESLMREMERRNAVLADDAKFTADEMKFYMEEEIKAYRANLKIQKPGLGKAIKNKAIGLWNSAMSLPANGWNRGKIIVGSGLSIGTGVLIYAGIVYFTFRGVEALSVSEEKRQQLISEVNDAIDELENELQAIDQEG